jgi:hypothetical protein
MIACGMGAILLNVQAKLDRDENLTFMIWATQVGYVKALRGIWMECN